MKSKNKSKFLLLILISVLFYSCFNEYVFTNPCVNPTYDIENFQQTEVVSDQFVEHLLNADFSHDGSYIFMGSEFTYEQYRFPLLTNWDITTIQPYDQLNSSYSVYSVFGNNGLFRYKKIYLGSTWFRQSLDSPYNLNKISQDNEVNGLTVWNFIYFLNDGSKFYGISGTELFEYNVSNSWSIESPVNFESTEIDSIIPNDNLNFKGIQYNDDGTRVFISKSENKSPFRTIIYQADCSIPFVFSSATYNNVSLTFNGTYELDTMKFNNDGSALYTIEGNIIQYIRKFTFVCN